MDCSLTVSFPISDRRTKSVVVCWQARSEYSGEPLNLLFYFIYIIIFISIVVRKVHWKCANDMWKAAIPYPLQYPWPTVPNQSISSHRTLHSLSACSHLGSTKDGGKHGLQLCEINNYTNFSPGELRLHYIMNTSAIQIIQLCCGIAANIKQYAPDSQTNSNCACDSRPHALAKYIKCGALIMHRAASVFKNQSIALK